MRKEDLEKAFSEIDDCYISEAVETTKESMQGTKNGKLYALSGIAACLVIVFSVMAVVTASRNKNEREPMKTGLAETACPTAATTPEPSDNAGEDKGMYLNLFKGMFYSAPPDNMPTGTEAPMSPKELKMAAKAVQKLINESEELFGPDCLEFIAEYDFIAGYDGEYLKSLTMNGKRVFARYNDAYKEFYIRDGNGQRYVYAEFTESEEEPDFWCELSNELNVFSVVSILHPEYTGKFPVDENGNLFFDEFDEQEQLRRITEENN